MSEAKAEAHVHEWAVKTIDGAVHYAYLLGCVTCTDSGVVIGQSENQALKVELEEYKSSADAEADWELSA